MFRLNVQNEYTFGGNCHFQTDPEKSDDELNMIDGLESDNFPVGHINLLGLPFFPESPNPRGSSIRAVSEGCSEAAVVCYALCVVRRTTVIITG